MHVFLFFLLLFLIFEFIKMDEMKVCIRLTLNTVLLHG